MQTEPVCTFFGSAKGCRNKCNLSHDRPNDIPECRDYKRGSCKYDKSCKYRHEVFKIVENNWVPSCSIASFPHDGGNKQRKQASSKSVRQSRRNNKKKAAAKQTILLQSVPIIKSNINNHSDSKPLSYAERARLSSQKNNPVLAPQPPPQQKPPPAPVIQEEPEVEQVVENSPNEEPVEPEVTSESENNYSLVEEEVMMAGEIDIGLPPIEATEDITEMISSIEIPCEPPLIMEKTIEQKEPTPNKKHPPGIPLDRPHPSETQQLEQNNNKFHQQAQQQTIPQGRVQHFENHNMYTQRLPNMHQRQVQNQPIPPPQQRRQMAVHHQRPPIQRFQQPPPQHPHHPPIQNQPPHHMPTYYHPIQYNPQYSHHPQYQPVQLVVNTQTGQFMPVPLVHNTHGQLVQNTHAPYILQQYPTPNNFHAPEQHQQQHLVFSQINHQQYPPSYENGQN